MDALKSDFVKLCLQDQDCFRSEQGWEALLALLPGDRETIGSLRRKWEASPDQSSEKRWDDLKHVVSSLQKSNGPLYVSHRSSAYTDRQRKYLKALEDVILQYTYPRIDAEVSKHRNHLLKAPFCVHPGTGELAYSA